MGQPEPAVTGNGQQGFPPGEAGCPAHREDRIDLTNGLAGHAAAKPALGMSADYFLPPTPNTSEPPSPSECAAVADAYDAGTAPSQSQGLNCKSLASLEYSKHGIDTGELVIRGGSHLDFSFIPNHAFGASLRGADLVSWYTTAWFDKYVKGDPTADRRLLTDRWRHDIQEGEIDPDRDADMFSFYHPSRLDFTRSDGTKVDCEDLRAGCPALTAEDGFPGEYSYAAIDRSPDRGTLAVPASGLPRACRSERTVTVQPLGGRAARVTRVVAYAGKRRVGSARGGRVRIRVVGLPRRAVRVRLVITESRHGHQVRRREYRTYHPCRAR